MEIVTMKAGITVIALLLFGSTLRAQEVEDRPQDLTQFNDSSNQSSAIKVNPDVVDLVVELEPTAYGNRARERTMQVNLELDPLVQGRATVGYQLKILESLMLDFPVYFEASQASVPFGKWAGLFNANLESY